MRLALVTLLVALAASSASAVSLTLKHRPSEIFNAENAARHSSFLQSRWMKGSDYYKYHNFPMNGGLLTMGAYFLESIVGAGPGQIAFNTLVDTGSSNLGVPGVGCKSCGNGTKLYDARKSTAFQNVPCDSFVCRNCEVLPVIGSPYENTQNKKNPGQKTMTNRGKREGFLECAYGAPFCVEQESESQCGMEILYGGGQSAIVGAIKYDRVCIGDSSLCGYSYVDSLVDMYPTGTLSMGILGLAYPSNACNPTCQQMVIDSLVEQGHLGANKFGMCLNPSKGGSLDLGDYNSSRYSGSMQYTSIVHKHWYNLELLDVLVDQQSIGVPQVFYTFKNDVIGSFVDSGTSILIFGHYPFNALKSLLQTRYCHVPHLCGNNTVFEGCVNIPSPSTLDLFPKIQLRIRGAVGYNGDFDLEIDAHNYLLAVGGNNYCLGIAPVSGIGAVIGDVVMENYYIEFDRAGDKLGFAPVVRANCGN